MTVKIFTTAHLPPDLVNAWLQHLRDFDTAHPGCHFEVAVEAPEMPLAAMVEALRLDPELTFSELIARKGAKPERWPPPLQRHCGNPKCANMLPFAATARRRFCSDACRIAASRARRAT